MVWGRDDKVREGCEVYYFLKCIFNDIDCGMVLKLYLLIEMVIMYVYIIYLNNVLYSILVVNVIGLDIILVWDFILYLFLLVV